MVSSLESGCCEGLEEASVIHFLLRARGWGGLEPGSPTRRDPGALLEAGKPRPGG